MNGIASRINLIAAANLIKLGDLAFLTILILTNCPSILGVRLRSDKAAVNFSPLNKAINMLTDLNQETGGHTFRHLSHYKKFEFGHYYFFCCQNADKSLLTESPGKCDRHQMKNFDCKSRLSIQPNLSDSRLSVKL